MEPRKYAVGGLIPPAMLRPNEAVIPPGSTLLTEPDRYPNLAERVVKVALHVVAIIALVLASALMVVAIRAGVAIGESVQRIAPQPLVTGCPFGDGECGG